MKRTICSLLAMVWLFGCSSSSIVEQAKLLGTRHFTQDAWAKGNQEQRGEMVYSFLTQHDPVSLSSTDVKKLLGESTGYYDYDENPAYLVGPASVESEYGKGYLLAFVADKTSGKITTVKIVPQPK